MSADRETTLREKVARALHAHWEHPKPWEDASDSERAMHLSDATAAIAAVRAHEMPHDQTAEPDEPDILARIARTLPQHVPLAHEAAAEIKRLRAENDKLQAIRQVARSVVTFCLAGTDDEQDAAVRELGRALADAE